MNPTNHASRQSLVVPVLPAIGLPTALHDLAGAPLDHPLQHRHDLEGRAGIGHLLARIRDDRHRLIAANRHLRSRWHGR